MRIIKPSAKIVDISKLSRVKLMEMAGRICYRSEDKTTKESAESFVEGVIKKKHWSVTEFAVFTMRIKTSQYNVDHFLMLDNKYLTVDIEPQGTLLVTGTARAFRNAFANYPKNWILNSFLSYLQYHYPIFFKEFSITQNTSCHSHLLTNKEINILPSYLFERHKWVLVKYVVNRAVSHELVRHRPVSWLQESQRYCRYDQDKFDNEVTFIDPLFFDIGTKEYSLWAKAMEATEKIYLQLLKTCSPQAARTVLPNSCKTELVQFCNLTQWKIFFGLRDAPGKAEPSMVEVVAPLHKEFKTEFPDVFA